MPAGMKLVMDLTNKEQLDQYKKNPINIKEGVSYKYVIRLLFSCCALTDLSPKCSYELPGQSRYQFCESNILIHALLYITNNVCRVFATSKSSSELELRVRFISHFSPSLLQLFITVDRMEQMLGSYGVSPDGSPKSTNFPEEESPSGMLARSGTYNVKSRVVDDDGKIYAGTSPLSGSSPLHLMDDFLVDWEWAFKLTKEW